MGQNELFRAVPRRMMPSACKGDGMTLSNSILDTRFRSALGRMADQGRLQTYSAPADPNLAAIQLDFGRHLRAAYERAQKKGQHLPVVVCIGSDLALHYTAATMGSQMPENADELAVAGGLCGRPLSVVKAVSQDLLVPAESEIVLEGLLKCDEEIMEGPFGEFVGYLAPADPGPVLEITAGAHRA